MSVQIVKLLDPIQLVFGNLNFTGAYNNGTAYVTGDSVSYNGSSYVAITATTGNLPTDTGYWQLLSQGTDTEGIEDTIGAILTDTATIDFTYTDATPSITADVKDSSITNIKIATGIDAVKIGTGSVSNTEYGYLDGVTSAIQTQLDASTTNLSNHLVDTIDAHDASAISNIPSGNLSATEVQAALNELQSDIDTLNTIKAPLASPALTGIPTSPTASANNNSTQIATTAYVDGAILTSANLLTKDYHVDKTGNDSTGNGSKEKPFLTIQAALTAAGNAANLADFKTHVIVNISSGVYDESLTLPRGRTVTLLGRGQIILGDGAGSNWSSTTPRSITADFRNEDVFSSDIKPALNIVTIPNVDPTSTFLAEAGCFRMSGNLNITCGGSPVSSTVNLSSVKIDGLVSSTTTGLVNFLLNKVYIVGTVTAATGVLLRCSDSQFDSLINVDGYNSFTNCEIKAGMTVTTNFNSLPPSGIFHSTLLGTFTGPASSIKLDLTSDYYFRTNSAVLGGVATKVLLAPTATTSITGVLSSTDWTTFNDKAPTVSPIFTGTPTAPTAVTNTNNTQIATTAFVQEASIINALIFG
jgi:hypothetical protein